MLASCGSHASSVCDLVCECEHCSDLASDNCVTSLEGTAKYSEAYGCDQEFDDLLTCVEDKGECDDKEARFSTSKETTDTCGLVSTGLDCTTDATVCNAYPNATCETGQCRYNACAKSMSPCTTAADCPSVGSTDRCEKQQEDLGKCIEKNTGHKQETAQPQPGGQGGATGG